ncbi:MAG TPA: aspartate carbamoyltransferase catalytic subunit, partial [Paracoccaceae bacterium]|nr:aspartate carbamoyltransferase catalytic subunit [Paracoccaceae bacterium]
MFKRRHLLGIEDLAREEILAILDLAERYVAQGRQPSKRAGGLEGRTLVNMFFEPSTRTQASFELAGKRLGADVMNMAMAASSLRKGETLIDTALTLTAMLPDVLVVRHPESGAVALLSRHVRCAVINAGDGKHEHPTQALLDAFTIRDRLGRVEGLTIAICGDVAHSRVARSNVALLTLLGAQVRLIGPPTLMPAGAERWGAKVFHNMRDGLKDADVVMMLRVQRERMAGGFFPSPREYFWFYGLDEDKLKLAKPNALVMHPGPMNRGIEIDSSVADDPNVSLIETQVRMGVAVR